MGFCGPKKPCPAVLPELLPLVPPASLPELLADVLPLLLPELLLPELALLVLPDVLPEALPIELPEAPLLPEVLPPLDVPPSSLDDSVECELQAAKPPSHTAHATLKAVSFTFVLPATPKATVHPSAVSRSHRQTTARSRRPRHPGSCEKKDQSAPVASPQGRPLRRSRRARARRVVARTSGASRCRGSLFIAGVRFGTRIPAPSPL